MELNFIEEGSDKWNRLKLKAFEVESVSHADGPLVHFDQSLLFGGVIVEDETYGPLVFNLQARNFDGEVLSDFQQKVYAVYRDANTYQPDEFVAELIPLYSDLLVNLLKGNPELTVKQLSLETPMGDAEGRMQIRFSGVPADGVEGPAALLMAPQYLDAFADVKMDESLVRGIMISQMKNSLQMDAVVKGTEPMYSDDEITMLATQQFEAQLGMLAAQRFVVREGGTISSRATFNGGELLVNGQPIPLFQAQ